MNNTLFDLSQLIDDDNPFGFYTIASRAVSYTTLRQFILSHISHQQRQVYDIIHTKPGCSSSVIEVELNLNRHHISNILKLLLKLKLVTREKVHPEPGLVLGQSKGLRVGGLYRYEVVE